MTVKQNNVLWLANKKCGILTEIMVAQGHNAVRLMCKLLAGCGAVTDAAEMHQHNVPDLLGSEGLTSVHLLVRSAG